MSDSHQFINLPSGISLEARLIVHPQNQAKLAVCLHPWSRLGGNMDDPVLHALTEPLLDHNYHVLTFNCRGVGRSTGWPSFTGMSEANDLREVVQWALETIPAILSVVIIGYSYGSLLASLHPTLPLPVKTSHVLLSYPLSTRGLLTLFRTKTYATELEQLVRNPAANVLIVYGNHDEFTGEANYESWAGELQSAATGAVLKVVKVENATHFWRGEQEQELREVVGRWLP